MGKRRSQAAFSLFSFQDIITSVTAILILVMLMLSIQMISRRRQQASSDPGVSLRQIEAAAESLESLAASLQDDLDSRRKARPLAALRSARAVAERERDIARHSLEETQRMGEAARRLLAEAESAAAAADSEQLAALETAAENDRQEADRLEAENNREEMRQEQRLREITERPNSGTELVFNPPSDSNRRAWLVEISDRGIAAALLGGEGPEPLGADTGDQSRLARWIARLKPDGDYCLLLIRPSAADELSLMLEKRLDNAGIRYGVDLIGEDQVVRDGTKPRTDG